MATHVYLIRHGESQANRRDVFLGHGDLDLTELGYAQARKTAEYLSTVPIDVIYTSDLSRAYHTACETAEGQGLKVIKNQNLREIDAGAWDFRTFDDLIENDPAFAVWRSNVGRACPTGGESTLALQARIVGELTRYAELHDGKTVAVFTHGTPIRTFAAYCEGKDVDGIGDIPWASNASVTHAVYENGAFRLIEYSRDDFMGDMVTALPPTT